MKLLKQELTSIFQLKSTEKLQKLVLKKLTEDICNGNVRNPEKVVASAAGELKSDTPKWIVDIDDSTIYNDAMDWLFSWFSYAGDPLLEIYKTNPMYWDWHYDTIPTIHGKHILVKPFNLQLFHQDFPNIDVHKNSMGTLLYAPDFTSK